jgi:hypothetical protein
MKYMRAAILVVFLAGCDHHGISQLAFDDIGVKEECKYQTGAINVESFCKYTNRKGTSVCSGSRGEGGFAIPCSFYEEL